MITFVVDVAQWFPNEKEPEDSYLDEEENDDSSRRKRRVPQFVSAVEVILKRTKHLTSSRELKIRLLVLKLIELAVLALTHFSNTLCPLVHENWPGVKLNANGDNFLARKHALKVIVAMCQITGSFMYRRFTKEIWPSLQESMTRLLADAEKRSGDGTIISESYKYQRSVLKHLVTIWENIEPLEEDWNSVRHILSAYSCSPFIHKDLVVLAKKSLEKNVCKLTATLCNERMGRTSVQCRFQYKFGLILTPRSQIPSSADDCAVTFTADSRSFAQTGNSGRKSPSFLKI
ncbi:TELO2-interacting protein 1 -like protein [Toxocara canis]|uniref:TELO2-interacting protein 1-like protein n=1 Tax=Toxocara canis TaxID=6265 RepID=A0A0B2V7C3_TOXCA|nr:TELO2-interacting protein 1 -like protein [Toxocara canis]